MRSIKPVQIAASAFVASLVLAPGALAAKHAELKQPGAIKNGRCRLTINAAPRFIGSGESALVYGQLACAGTGVASQVVTVLERSAGTPGLTTAGTATTDAGGHYQLSTPPVLTNSIFYAQAQAAHSSHRSVKVSPTVTLVGPPDGSQLFTRAGPFKQGPLPHGALRNVVRFTGHVSPLDAGARVVLQRENAVAVEEWHRIGLGVVDREGNYSIVHAFGTPGDTNIRVVVRPTGSNAAGASEALSYEISQAQNRQLTISSSADPLSYGQSTTISGTSAAAPGTPLTLLARTRTQSTFAPVASTVSTASNTYSFAPQTPLQNTLYKVTGAGKTSAQVSEGIKYALTAAVSSSSIQVGQPLVFSGTVAPAIAGHPVYLQAQNASGIGFHVVEVASVAAGGTYSISHTVYGALVSQRKFRVKVPGDPQNQGVAGTPLQVSVTPAPGAPLAPESPGNSSQPHEGQV